MTAKRILLFLILVLAALPLLSTAEEDLLDPDQAFSLQVSPVDANTVRATWTIADGYYMYRAKIRFSTDTDGVTLGEPALPPGKVKHDEFFGDIQIYRGTVSVDVPVTRTADAPGTIALTARSQGCADRGICYPPHRQHASITLPKVAAAAPLADVGQDLGMGAGDQAILEPDQAFAFSAEAADAKHLRLHWVIAPHHYLYRDKLNFKLKNAEGVTLGQPQVPAGEEKDDEFFGKIRVFHHELEVLLPLEGEASRVTLEAGYQGCNETKGICYPPIHKTVSLDLGGADATTAAPAALPEVPAPPSNDLSEQDRLAQSLAGGNTPLTILTFFGLGLLLAFTPCVFPMIPILSSIIVGQGAALTTRRAFSLSLVYVLAMAATYTIAGVVAALFGANLQAAFQNPWILISFSAVFVALALSMFGFYELQLPSSLQGRLSEVSNRQQGGTLAGVAIMGLLSALIVGPCVAPPLMGALIYIGQTGDPWLGGAALFALSLGMGAPLLVVGTSAGKILPRAGAWMDKVKAVFGILLLAVAIWMLERILPPVVIMALWAALLIISAVYAGALEPIREGASGWFRLWKGVGVVLLIYGTLLLIATASGGRDPLQPLRHLRLSGTPAGSTNTEAPALEFKRVKSISDLEREIAAASARGQPVMLDFYADWCVSCKEFERYTFSDAGVRRAAAGALLLQANVTANDGADKALLQHFRLLGPPSILFFGPDGKERRAFRVVGYMGPEQFRTHLEKALPR